MSSISTTLSPLSSLIFYPPYAVDVYSSSTNYTEVIKVQTSISISAMYFIVAVSNSVLFGNETTSGLGLNANVDECNSRIISSFPEPRKYFCIDHHLGIIYTTQHFADRNILDGIKYNILVKVQIGDEEKNLIYTVTVKTDNNCRAINNVIKMLSMNPNCSKPLLTILLPSELSETIEDSLKKFQKVHYFVAFELRLPGNIVIETDVNISVAIKINNKSMVAKIQYIYGGVKKYVVYLQKPILMSYSNRESSKPITITTSYLYDGIEQTISLEKDSYKLYFLTNTDYCTQGQSCIKNSVDLKQVLLVSKCNILDPHMYMYKYGFCLVSKRPSVSTERYSIDAPITESKQIISNNYTLNSNFLRYTMLFVQGPIDKDFGTASGQQPSNCDGDIKYEPPQNYFCLDSTTGNIYATQDIVGKSSNRNLYTINIKVANINFPYREANGTLSIVMEDRCYPARDYFTEFKNLLCGKVVSLHRANSSFHFSPGEDVKQLIGFEILQQGSEIIDSDTKITLTLNNNVAKVVSVSDMIKRNGYYNYILNISTDEIKNTFHVSFENAYVPVQNFRFAVIKSYTGCDKSQCLDAYSRWKKSYTLKLQSNKNCNNRIEVFYNVFYEQCFNLKPAFLESEAPVRVNTSSINIKGCNYRSIIRMQEFEYFLLNDKIRINNSLVIRPLRKRRALNGLRGDIFSTFSFDITSFTQQGYIQCVIYDPKRMKKAVKSDKLLIKISLPKFVQSPTSVTIDAGSPFTLRCSVSSYVKFAASETFWFKSGKDIIQRNNVDTVFTDETNGQGIIYQIEALNVRKSNLTFQGSYQCGIFVPGFMNSPVLSQKANVFVNELLLNFIMPPSWFENDFSKTVTVRGCVFQFINSSLDVDMTNHSYYLVNGSMRINLRQRVQRQEVGIAFPDLKLTSYNQVGFFQCVIFDPVKMYEPVKSLSTTLMVALSETKFVVQLKVALQPVKVGDFWELTGCQVKSPVPVTYIHILQNGNIIHKSSSFMRNFSLVSNGLQSVASLESEGYYQCSVLPEGLQQPVLSEKVFLAKLQALEATIVTRKPKVTKINGTLYIEGCSYMSTQNMLQYSYWLVNGSIQINTNEVPQIGNLPPGEDFDQRIRNASYKFPDIPVTLIGTYQCVIFSKSVMRKPVASLETEILIQTPPTFMQHPTITNKKIKIGEGFSITGCSFYSDIQLDGNDIYFLKDGLIKQSSIGLDSPLHFGFFGKFDVRISTFENQGYYQCGIFKKGYMKEAVLSKKVHVQFQELSDTRVTIKLDRQWSPKYSNRISKEYLELKQNIEDKLLQAFKASDNAAESQRKIQVIGFSPGSVNAITRIIYTNVTSTERLDYCSSIQSSLNKDIFTGLPVIALEVQNLDCCPINRTGEEPFKGVYDYVRTLATEVSVNKNCVYNQDRKSSRYCQQNMDTGPQWSVVNLEKCNPKYKITKLLNDLNKTVICGNDTTKDCVSPLVVARNLSEITSNNSILIHQDITFVSNTISNIVNSLNASNNISATKQVLNDLLSTYNNVLDIDVNIIGVAQAETSSSSSLLNNLDSVAKVISQTLSSNSTTKNITIEKTNIAFAVKSAPKNNIEITARESSNVNGNNLQLDIDGGNATQVANDPSVLALIEVPEEAFPTDQEIVYSFFFEKSSLFLPVDQLKQISGENEEAKQVVQSVVLAVSIGSQKVENLTKSIILTFKKTNVNRPGQDICSFWDFDLESGIPGVRGGFSSRGCQLVNTPKNVDNYVTCECNHLTNFALLLDVGQTINNPLELKIITWIGCAISIFGLVITILTFLLFRNLAKKLPTKILISLSISLLLLIVVFLIGVERTSPRLGCQIVSGFLHYLILTTFFWMFVEAISLYRSFITVFKQGSESRFFIKASVFGWGAPALIVAITAGIKHEEYGNEKICTVLGYPFYFAVLLPVALVICVNFVVLTIVLRVLHKNAAKRAARLNQYPDRFASTRIAFACNALLGVTWVFAVFAVKDATDVFQWLFCIFNSLQGFFIFIFYTVRNKDVRKEWQKLICKKTRNENTSSTGPSKYELSKKSGSYDIRGSQKTSEAYLTLDANGN